MAAAGSRDTRDESVFRASREVCVPAEMGRQGLIFQEESFISEVLPEDTKQPHNLLSLLPILSSSHLVNLGALFGCMQRVEKTFKLKYQF